MNKNVIDKLNSQITNNKISHAYLFEVNNYEDDYIIILNFVKMILSNSLYNDVLDSDISYFKQIDHNQYIDLYVIEPDGNDIKKNQMIKLIDEFNNKSFLNNKRIYIIKECDKFNTSSANTILKFLEEPNDDIIGILITNNRYKVLETIISRCQIISFNNNDNFVFNEEYYDLIDFLLYIKKNITNYDDIFDKYFYDKKVSNQTLVQLQEIFINSLNESCDIDILKKLNETKISNFVLLLEEEKNKLKFNVNLKLWFDDFVVRVMEVIE